MTHKACSQECAVILAEQFRAKQEKRDTQERKLALKRRRDWLAEAQHAFNAYIRKRDENLPCISCGRFHQGQFHAGHYRSVGAAGHLRFDEDNVHKQCAPCNNHKSGNVVEYRIHLVERIGVERVTALETNNETRKWTTDDAKAIKAEYRAKLKALNE